MCSIFKISQICKNDKLTDKEVCQEHNDIILIQTDICNVCLDKINENIYMECGHSFHKECINVWLEKNNNCPICRKILKHIPDENLNSFVLNVSGRRLQYLSDHSSNIINLNMQSLLGEERIQSSEVNTRPSYLDISFTETFVEWFREMVNTYIHNDEYNFNNILNYIRTSESDLIYFIDISNLDINNQPINLFELELKINEISNISSNAYYFHYSIN